MTHFGNGRRPEINMNFVGLSQNLQGSIEGSITREINQVKWLISGYRQLANVINAQGSVIVFNFSDIVAESHIQNMQEIAQRKPLCLVILTITKSNHRQIRQSLKNYRIPYVLLLQPVNFTKLNSFLLEVLSK